MDYSVHGIFQAKILEWVTVPFSSGSSTLQADSLPTEHQGSPIILEWVAYPFSSGILLTQELHWGLLQCRWILYSQATREAGQKQQNR